MHLVHATHATKFRLALFAAIALLAVIGAIVVLPLNAEAGQRLKITGIDMNITPTADATLDNKKVDITLTWSASRNATGYQIDRRHRIDGLSGPIAIDTQWTGWKADRKESDSASSATINYTYSFDQVGKYVEWRIRVKNANGKWSPRRCVVVSWGVRKDCPDHYQIKREWFYPEDHPVLN